MNRVFASQLRKGRGLVYFAPAERIVLLAFGSVVFVLAGFIIAVAAAAALGALLFVHRRLDNGRYDHLELLVRRKGLRPAPCWSLCERDEQYRELDR